MSIVCLPPLECKLPKGRNHVSYSLLYYLVLEHDLVHTVHSINNHSTKKGGRTELFYGGSSDIYTSRTSSNCEVFKISRIRKHDIKSF